MYLNMQIGVGDEVTIASLAVLVYELGPSYVS